jgi:hypothetical protein
MPLRVGCSRLLLLPGLRMGDLGSGGIGAGEEEPARRGWRYEEGVVVREERKAESRRKVE